MNKKGIICFGSTLFLLGISILGIAGNPPAVIWAVKNPFEQKVFIENKGQYYIQGKVDPKCILFGTRQEGLQYYFTANSIWIKRSVAVRRTEKEIEALKYKGSDKENSTGEKDDKEFQTKFVDEFHQIKFINANPESNITSENQVSQNYNFSVDSKITVQCNGYKKIIYHNLYSGIDMEIYFPEDKEGFEYSFIVHPGADVSQIKIQYPLNNERIQLTEDNNIVIASQFGNFIDHAPIANQRGKTIKCLFSFNNSIVGFSVEDYDKTKNLVIDPWVITPTFTGTNSAYDVDWDNAGNCYVYGGSYPWQIEKFNASGNSLWSYTTVFGNTSDPSYGGFAVDRISQSVYVIEGFDPTYGAQAYKLNSLGIVIDTFTGSTHMNEMWRVAFSRCTNQAVIGGGGTSSPSAQVCYLDTNITNLSPVNVLDTPGCCHDMWGITIDNYGNCYTATCDNYAGNGGALIFNNVLLKMPLPNLKPTTWIVSNGYQFQEAQSVVYAGTNVNSGGCCFDPNGFNGITISDTELYTYDSYTLKKWSSATGALINSATINTTGDNSLMYWGGLASDDCDHIFLGSITDIKQYDGSLKLIKTITAPDTVYDVKLGLNNMLYACGKNFVEAIQDSLPSCYPITFQNQINNPNCTTSTSSVIVIAKGGTAPPAITWNTIPVQVGDTAKNLSGGTYIATIINNTCPLDTAYDTVQIQSSPTLPIIIVNSPTTCLGVPINLIAKGATTYMWSPSTGLSATTGDSVIANPTITSTYIVTGKDSLTGCTASATDTVSVEKGPNKPVITKNGNVLTSSATQGNQWYLNDTIIDEATNETYKATAVGCYSVIATNPVNGCSSISDTMCVTTLTGIAPLPINSDQLSIYPNPTGGEIFITISSSIAEINDWNLEITDVLGRIVYARYSLNYNNDIDLSNLLGGVYFISVTNNAGRLVVPVIKQ